MSLRAFPAIYFLIFWFLLHDEFDLGVVTDGQVTSIEEKMKEAELYSTNPATRGQAGTIYMELIEAFPDEAISAYVELGRLTARGGDLAQAESLYQEALARDPNCAGAYVALGKLRLHASAFDEARSLFSKSLESDETNADAYHAFAKALNGLEQLEEATLAFEKSLQLDPKNVWCMFDLGVTLAKMGRFEECDGYFEKAKDLAPNLDNIMLGQVHQAFGRWEKAAAELEVGLAKKPDHADGWLSYGQALEMLSFDDQAAAAYETILNLNPEYSEASFRLAQVLSGTGLNNFAAVHACGLNTERVIQLYQKTLQLNPEHEGAREALENCYFEVGETVKWEQRILEAKQYATQDQPSEPPSKTGKLQSLVEGISKKKQPSKRSSWPSEVGGFKGIPEIEITTAEEFMQNYVKASKPAKITNFQEDFVPKVDWDLDNLREKFGSSLVHVSISESGRFDGPESGDLWGIPGEEVLVRPPGTSMQFSQFLDLMELQNITETFYLEYLALHQYLGTKALQMIPQPAQAVNSGMEHLLTNYWMGFTPTTSPLHYDDYENLLCQIRGKKELILFPPQDMGYLYYIGRSKGQLEYEFPGNFKREKLSESRNVVFGSSVYLDNPDFQRHSELLKATPYKVEINPGDVLYLPAYWHHEVKSTPDKESVNIAINFWYKNETYFEDEEVFLRAKSKVPLQSQKQEL